MAFLIAFVTALAVLWGLYWTGYCLLQWVKYLMNVGVWNMWELLVPVSFMTVLSGITFLPSDIGMIIIGVGELGMTVVTVKVLMINHVFPFNIKKAGDV